MRWSAFDGDRSAFDVLLNELWPVISSFAERGVGRGADAEDIAQEVFYRVCSRITDFDRSRDGVSWVFGIASYEIMTYWKRAKRRREVHDETAIANKADRADSQEAQLLEREISLAFEHTIGALTEEDREILGRLASASVRPREPRATQTQAARARPPARPLEEHLWRTVSS